MKLFDTHCHLCDERFDEDRAQVIERMRAAGVERALLVGIDSEKSLDERAALAESAGAQVVGRSFQKRPKPGIWRSRLA